MNCEQIRDLIFESFGELDISEEIKGHLSSCEECRKLFEMMKSQASEFGSDSAFESTESEQAELLEKINSDIDRHEVEKVVKVEPAWKSYVPMAAAIILVLGVGFISQLVFQFGNDSDTALIDQPIDTLYVALTEDEISEIKSLELDEFVDQYSSQYNIGDEMNMLDDLSEEEYQYLNEHLDIGEIL